MNPGTTWEVSIEPLMGERNKIKSASLRHSCRSRKNRRTRRFFRYTFALLSNAWWGIDRGVQVCYTSRGFMTTRFGRFQRRTRFHGFDKNRMPATQIQPVSSTPNLNWKDPMKTKFWSRLYWVTAAAAAGFATVIIYECLKNQHLLETMKHY